MPDYLPEQEPSIPLGFKGPVISPDIQTLLILSSSSVCLHKLWVVKKSMACCWVIWIHLVVCSAIVVCNFLDLHEHLNSAMYMFCELTMTVCYSMQYGLSVWILILLQTNLISVLWSTCQASVLLAFISLFTTFPGLINCSHSLLSQNIFGIGLQNCREDLLQNISQKKKN